MKRKNKHVPTISDLLLYRTGDGKTNIEVRLQDETVWMSQMAMAELFQTTIPNINIHLINAYGEGELSETATIKDYLIVHVPHICGEHEPLFSGYSMHFIKLIVYN